MARARSFGSIRKLPSGRYQARYWHLGTQVAADTTFPSKTDARRWLSTVEADMVRGVWVDPDAGRIPFGDYATRRVAERPVRPRTREIYENQLRHIVVVFANVHLCDVHPVDVRTWHGRLAASGLHHNTVAKIYRLFRSIMTTAVDDGLIAKNLVRIKGASAERMVERPLLTWDDVRALAVAIHPRFECLVRTAAASGLRFGELTGLTIEHVDLDRRELRVAQALHDIRGQGPTLGPPKTESAVRTAPVAESIAERLAAHVEEYVQDTGPDALVFTSLRGGPLLNTYFAPQSSNTEVERSPTRSGDAWKADPALRWSSTEFDPLLELLPILPSRVLPIWLSQALQSLLQAPLPITELLHPCARGRCCDCLGRSARGVGSPISWPTNMSQWRYGMVRSLPPTTPELHVGG